MTHIHASASRRYQGAELLKIGFFFVEHAGELPVIYIKKREKERPYTTSKTPAQHCASVLLSFFFFV